MIRPAIAALLLLPAAANAAVYKCSIDGHMTFQDHPCAGESELMLMQQQPPINSEAPASANPTADWLQLADRDSKGRQIESLERQNRQLTSDMNRQLEAVRKETSAPGYYGADVADRTDRVKRDFDGRLKANQSKIDALRNDIEQR